MSSMLGSTTPNRSIRVRLEVLQLFEQVSRRATLTGWVVYVNVASVENIQFLATIQTECYTYNVQ